MKTMNSPVDHKYNCLFLPGLPGRIKNFDFFQDITDTGGRVHWLQYSGTYESKSVSKFSISSSVKDIEEALDELTKKGLPIIVVAYSYSTSLVNMIDYTKYTSIIGMALFSPIQGLDTSSINENFQSTIRQLYKEDDISVDMEDWDGDSLRSHSNTHYEQFLKELCANSFPVMIAYSQNDTTIKVDDLRKKIANYRSNTAYNKVLIFEQPDGYHRLDSYYDSKIGNFFRAVEIELDLMKLLENNIFVYFWGSSLNYNYSGKDSDIDLLIFYDGYLEKYKELNNYVEKYNKSHDITFDLSINNKADLLSKKIFRYNRGPVAIHELQYAYFPLRQATELIDLDWKDVVKDAYSASLILSGESKKILSKCDISSERVKKIIKYSITVFTYLQYVKGVKNLDLNHVEIYLSTDDPFYESIARSIELKKLNYKGMTLNDLFSAVKGIDIIIKEQELLIGEV